MRLRGVEYKWLVAAAFVAGMFMDIIDTTIVNVALPTLGQNFGVGDGTFEWVVTGYLLSLAIWIPASGWIGIASGPGRRFCLHSWCSPPAPLCAEPRGTSSR